MYESLLQGVYLVLGVFIIVGNVFRWPVTRRAKSVQTLIKHLGARQVRLFALLIGLVAIVMGLPAALLPRPVVYAVEIALFVSLYAAAWQFVLRRRMQTRMPADR